MYDDIGDIFYWLVVLGVIILIFILVIKAILRRQDVDNLTTGKDYLLYFGMFYSLVYSVTAFLTIVFSAVDKLYPDILEYSYSKYVNSVGLTPVLASMVATLIIVYPLYIFSSYLIAKDLKNNPIKKDLTLRKSVIYLAMIIISITIISTAITTLTSYLMGSLVTSFLLKAFVVLIISAILFYYFYFSLKRDYTQSTQIPNILAVFSTIFIIFLIIWSINVFGTPGEVRKFRIDEQKINDLKIISGSINNYYIDKNRDNYYFDENKKEKSKVIPNSLDDLKIDLKNVNWKTEYRYIPGDFTGNYENRTVYDNNVRHNVEIAKPIYNYKLCTKFETSRDFKSNRSDDIEIIWNHPAGEYCFNLDTRQNNSYSYIYSY